MLPRPADWANDCSKSCPLSLVPCPLPWHHLAPSPYQTIGKQSSDECLTIVAKHSTLKIQRDSLVKVTSSPTPRFLNRITPLSHPSLASGWCQLLKSSGDSRCLHLAMFIAIIRLPAQFATTVRHHSSPASEFSAPSAS